MVRERDCRRMLHILDVDLYTLSHSVNTILVPDLQLTCWQQCVLSIA